MVMWSWFLIIEIVASICLAVFARGILLFVRRRQRLRTYFRGKHVWVTGASSGIGLEVSKLVAEYGARVTLSARSIDKLEAIVRECTSRGNEVFSVPMDIAGTYEEVEKAYQAAIAHFGPVDVLIANAGINNGGKKFLDLNPVIVESVISTNFRGTVYSTMAVAKDMVERGRGTIAGVSSLAAYRGLPRGSVYGGTKAAITNFLEAIRVELYSTGVKVVAIHPGFVDTPALGTHHVQPFLMTAHDAAMEVLLAVASDSSHYGFPLLMEHGLMRIARFVPNVIFDFVMYNSTR